MKHLLLSVFVIAFTANLSAQAYRVDTVTNETWTNNAWELAGRVIYTYNSSCQLVSTTTQTRNGSEWEDALLQTFTYTSGGQINDVTSQTWNSGAWTNVSKQIYTYSTSSKVDTTVTQLWSAGVWSNSVRTTNTYEVGSDYLTSTLTELSVGGVIWINQALTTYTNNTDGTVQEEVRQTWSGTAWVIQNRYRYTYTYDAQGRQLTQLTETWTNNAWVNSILDTNTYNDAGQLTTNTNQEWNTGSSAWDTDSQSTYTYNANGSINQVVSQAADNPGDPLVNASQSTFHYSTQCVLPLTLLDFNATLSGKDVVLKWTTSKEVNTSHFDIESSRNAETFSKIGSVNASMSSTQKINYHFIDANPTALAAGKIFYRLKMIDKDGKFSYSKIAFVSPSQGESLFSIFPTAVKNNLFLLYNTQNTHKAELRIVDQSGRQVYRQQVQPAQAGSQLNINVSGLQGGTYYLELVTNEGSRVSKFIKL